MIRLRDDREPGCDTAGRWARLYAMRGLVSLPSRPDKKAPAMRGYREFLYGQPMPEAWCDKWWAPNVQVVCGRPGGIVVVDLDGAEAADVWKSWRREHGGDPTWTVVTGGGNYQLWFRLPAGIEPFRRRLLWGRWDHETNNWAKHQAIELLGLGRLAMAPPSIHPETGRPYSWARERSPLFMPEPAVLPEWVLDIPEPRQPRRERETKSYPVPAAWKLPEAPEAEGVYSRQVVIDAMSPDQKVGLVAGWGLKLVADRANDCGFIPCRAIERDDRNPSASFHAEGGFYSEPGAGLVLSLFDLGHRLGHYPSWQSCCDDLGRRLRLTTRRA